MSDEDKPTRVAFDMHPLLAEEVHRIIELTDLKKAPELFKHAFGILRTYVDAMRKGQRVYIIDPDKPNEKLILIPPFHIKPMEEDDV